MVLFHGEGVRDRRLVNLICRPRIQRVEAHVLLDRLIPTGSGLSIK
jgi:hypothetical protein